MTDPLATYSESQFGLKRHFTLYADRVVVKGKNSRMTFETPVMLADLRPTAHKLWKRHWTFRWGIISLIVSIVPFFLASAIGLLNSRDRAAVVFLAVGIGLAILGGTICLRTFRPVEWTRYQNQFGTAVVVDVARTGPERDRYDEFVEALELQIMAAQRRA